VPQTLPRRRLLLGTAAGLPLLLGTAACSSHDLFAGPDPLQGPPPRPAGVIALQAVIAAEQDLIGLYRSAAGGTLAGSGELAPLLAQHRQHLARLRARLIVPPGSPAATGSAGPAGTGSAGPAGTGGAVSVARLRAAEQGSAAALVQRLAAVGPSLAQLLASIAACHATHASALSAFGRLPEESGDDTVTALRPVTALQGALAAEDAACWGYGVAGAHLTGGLRDAAVRDWTGHNEARDTLAGMIAARGGAPVAAQAGYQLPFAVHDTRSAMALAAYLEDGVTRAYLGLVAVADRRLRRFGALAMQGSAQRAAFWRGSTEAFPGLDGP
jgi:hypothetical protein